METAELRRTIAILESVPSWDAQGNFIYPHNQPIYLPPSSPKVRESPPGVDPDSYHGVPDGPPPSAQGLVRVSAPIPAPVHRITNQDVALFSDIAPYFETGIDEDGHPVCIDLSCQICGYAKLEMPNKVAPRGSGIEHDPVEGLSVLPCGHFFGSECIEQWIHTQEMEEKTPCCPMCRFKLFYPDDYCGHAIPIHSYIGWLPRNRQTPLTIPEGGHVPGLCKMCTWDQISEHVRRLNNLVFPRVPVGNFEPILGVRGPEMMARGAIDLGNDVYDMRTWTERQCLFW
ncbi:hypothetical protein F5X96DRAFT_695569 [Biscogniauxia mediterranea]|nr:hypothetical protein F5X96DRAFT_695569 [Biscogniauxia mediterranea]